jgi:hypothetical protein
VGVQIRSVSPSALDEVKRLASRSFRCFPGAELRYPFMWRLVGSRIRLGVSGEKRVSSDRDSNSGLSSS